MVGSDDKGALYEAASVHPFKLYLDKNSWSMSVATSAEANLLQLLSDSFLVYRDAL